MTLQNRVSPFGDIVASPTRGLMMGNRGGRLHNRDRQLGQARWRSRQWICCRLAFKGRHRAVMAANSYTELFFLDEATALAAGHRPCAECRRGDFNTFVRAWAVGGNPGSRAPEIDKVLHRQRAMVAGTGARPRVDSATAPAGAMVATGNDAWLVTPDGLRRWDFSGYGELCDHVPANLLTPPATVAALRAGYRPGLHPSATNNTNKEANQ